MREEETMDTIIGTKMAENLCLKRYGDESSPYVTTDVRTHVAEHNSSNRTPRVDVCTSNNQTAHLPCFSETAGRRRRGAGGSCWSGSTMKKVNFGVTPMGSRSS
jgi:hypothetical protein